MCSQVHGPAESGGVGPTTGPDLMENTNISCLSQESNPGRQACSLVAVPTELRRLLSSRYIDGAIPAGRTNKLRGLCPRANYTDRETAACRGS
jgi:hypothetical protein